MPLVDMLKENAERYGMPTNKERQKSGTPLKHFLRPIMEEAMKRKMMEMTQQMQRMPQMPESSVVEPPSVSPLQNRMMTESQGGTGGGISNSQGGAPGGP